MQKAILFDLDDTLIDTKYRHYKVVVDFLKINEYEQLLSFEDYVSVRLQKNLNNAQFISRLVPAQVEKFKSFWQTNIELDRYLNLDSEIVDYDLLKHTKKNIPVLIVLSLRSNVDMANNQLAKFPFNELIDTAIFLKHRMVNPKISAIAELRTKYEIVVMIGDTSSDLEAAQLNNISFAAVDTGWHHFPFSHRFSNVNEALKEMLQ